MRSETTIEFRLTEPEDEQFLIKWFSDPLVRQFFPLTTKEEIAESAKRWISFHQAKCSITATIDGQPVGIATLYLQPYLKLRHQCEMGIFVGRGFRNKGIGSKLMERIIDKAKNDFRIELLSLQVTDHNPAIRLYKRFGFKEYGRQTHWAKVDDRYTGRVLMERFL